MKRLLLVIALFSFMSLPAFSQIQASQNSKPKYERLPEIPPFSFTRTGNTPFTNKDLKKGVPTMIMLFSVDCSHCQHLTKEITKHIDLFEGTQILMITPFRYQQMYSYYKGYGLDKYTDIITVGSDSTRRLNMFYEQKYYPGLYLYGKDGKILFHAENDMPVKELAAHLKEQ